MQGAAQKSPEAFRTISEVADDIEIPQHVLRFWETKFAAVKPLKRGGGRRYYRPDDIDLLRGIRALLYRDGLTIKGVQKILREHGPRYVTELGRNATGFIQTLHLVDDSPGHERSPRRQVRAGEIHVDAENPRQTMKDLLGELLELKARLRVARSA